jgi:two-component system, chemotaxis family, CheB/CheR fusion protein
VRRGAGLVRDVTDRRRWEATQAMLIQELNHRVKNMLTVVQSVAHQTRRSTKEPDAFFRALEQRLQALALAHALLTERAWEGADLVTLVRSALGNFTAGAAQVTIEGKTVELAPNAAISFTVALYELGTNALKYGSLSVPEGAVEVRWEIEGAPGEEVLRFVWRERGGPTVKAPKRRGFGARMLEQGIARELEGAVTLDYAPQGLVCTMRLPTDGRFRRG